MKRVLIVAPLSITGVWKDEFQKFADFPYTLTILSGTLSQKIDTLRHMTSSTLQIAVINYESAWRMEDAIIKWKPDMIVLDESHKIKNPTASVSKAFHRMGERAQYRMILTGTAITNKALDIFSQYKFLDPRIFGQSYYSFRNRYFDMTGFGAHTPILKKSREPDLTRRIHSIAFKATKAQCLDLPETTDIIQYVDLEPVAMKAYTKLVKDSYLELKGGRDLLGGNIEGKVREVTATNVLIKLLRLLQLTGGFLGMDDRSPPQQVSKAKLSALEDIIDSSMESGQKLVIIARFLPEMYAIRKLLKDRHISYSSISGETKDRSEQVERFQNDPECMVFVGQIATAGMGITLTAASTMVFFSLDYSMSNFEQAKARIHRVGQKYPCTYIYLTARGTVDEKVLVALRDKADLAKSLIDDYRSGINPFREVKN